MDKEKKILFVMPRLPFPATSGRKTSLYHYCRILSEDLGYYLIVAAFLEEGDNPENKPDFIDELVILPKPSGKEKLKNIIIDSFLKKEKPLQVSLYWSTKAKHIVDDIVNTKMPSVVIGDMIRSTEYVRDLPLYRIADLDDRISLRYERQMETDIDGINPYGSFLYTVPTVMKKVMLLKGIKNFVVKTEIKLLKKYELQIGKCCERTVFVAQKEADDFNKELGQAKANAVPIGVDTKYFRYRPTGSSGDYIGFLGAMSVAHNENAVRHFAENIFPFILQKNPTAKFIIIGGGASEELKKIASQNIIFTGRVEDVRTELEKCKVFVCPMTFGSGIKTKNLEAMSLGLPVVTTSIGSENINAVNGSDWIVTDDNLEFAEKILELLNNEEERIKMGKCASEFIGNNFTWDVAKSRFEEILNG